MNKEKNYFQPTFGNKPDNIVGREGEITAFMRGLDEPVGSRDRCTLFLGQRGMGKTAMLLELAERAQSRDYIVARVTTHEKMPEAIIEQIQLNGSAFFKDEKKNLTGISAGALGFSFGLSFSEAAQQQYGFRTKMSLLCDRLEQKGKGILILIDEVHTSPAMREVATAYQELIGDGKNVAIGMAGLPNAVSGILNDKVLTFLNRATKVELDAISISSIAAYYEQAFNAMGLKHNMHDVGKAAEMSKGMPYLMQLIGYYIVQYSRDSRLIDEDVIKKAEAAALADMDSNVFAPIMAPLSENDRFFLTKMAEIGETVSTKELQVSMGKKGASIQVYRKRLVEAGIIEAPRRGELVFAVPYLADYLRRCG